LFGFPIAITSSLIEGLALAMLMYASSSAVSNVSKAKSYFAS